MFNPLNIQYKPETAKPKIEAGHFSGAIIFFGLIALIVSNEEKIVNLYHNFSISGHSFIWKIASSLREFDQHPSGIFLLLFVFFVAKHGDCKCKCGNCER